MAKWKLAYARLSCQIKNRNKIITMQFEEAQSIELETSPPLQYEQCEYCSRSFFKGKLKYHLKLCTPDNPMTISPKRSARLPHTRQEDTPKSLFLGKEEKVCTNCQAKLPPFLYDKHVERCQPKKEMEEQPQDSPAALNPKSATDVNFKERESPTLPLIIKRTIREKPLAPTRQPYLVKLREELSCFRRAQEIKQVQCPACQRIFSREASLRHVPICQALRNKERLSIALKRKGNKSVGGQIGTHRSLAGRKIVEDMQVGLKSNSVMSANPQNCQAGN